MGVNLYLVLALIDVLLCLNPFHNAVRLSEKNYDRGVFLLLLLLLLFSFPISVLKVKHWKFSLCREIKVPSPDCADCTGIWLWCITQAARLHQPPSVKRGHMLRPGPVPTPSQYGCLARRATQTSIRERLPCAAAGCLSSWLQNRRSENTRGGSDFCRRFNSTLLPTI